MPTKDSRARALSLVAALAVVTGCVPDASPTMPDTAPPPGLARATFLLTIDVATGVITIGGADGATTRPSGASMSLVGDDAVELQTTNCTWTNPGQNKRRCTFDLALVNRLSETDLVTPAAFPRVPAGANGILVFPFSAAALGSPGASASPSPDWDHAPENFFNDFSGCGGKNSDCYPYETFPGPLYGGEMTAPRTVGFDVDRNAHSVAAYIVVAADLRENPVQQAVIPADPNACGTVEVVRNTGSATASTGFPLAVGNRDGDVDAGRVDRGFCSFDLGNRYILGATLRVSQYDVGLNSYAGDVVVVDHVDFGTTIDGTDFDIDPFTAAIGTISNDASLGFKNLDVTSSVVADVAQGRTRSQFRLRFRDDETVPTQRVRFEGYMEFDMTPMANPPVLITTFKVK